MKVRFWLLTAIILTIFNIAVIIGFGFRFFSAPEPEFRGPMGPPTGLSDDQRDRLRSILENFRDQIQPLDRELRQIEREVMERLAEESPDTDAVKILIHRHVQLRDSLSMEGFAKILEIRPDMPEDEVRRLVQILIFRSGGPGGPPDGRPEGRPGFGPRRE